MGCVDTGDPAQSSTDQSPTTYKTVVAKPYLMPSEDMRGRSDPLIHAFPACGGGHSAPLMALRGAYASSAHAAFHSHRREGQDRCRRSRSGSYGSSTTEQNGRSRSDAAGGDVQWPGSSIMGSRDQTRRRKLTRFLPSPEFRRSIGMRAGTGGWRERIFSFLV